MRLTCISVSMFQLHFFVLCLTWLEQNKRAIKGMERYFNPLNYRWLHPFTVWPNSDLISEVDMAEVEF